MAKYRLFGGGKAQDSLQRCRSWARLVDAAERGVQGMSDVELRQAFDVLKQRCRNGASLDDLLPETFAIVREAAVRTLGERPYDEQLIGGAALHLGSVVEMKTGEGKTLTAVLAACLHALAGQGVHVMTANDYLVARDAEWMGPCYEFLGLRVTALAHGANRAERKAAYAGDIVYGTTNEFAYDYLRDNAAHALDELVQRGRFSAIVDEADLALLDEGGLEPQLSANTDTGSDHVRPAKLAARLEAGVHYVLDEGRRMVTPTERGIAAVEDWFGAAVYSGAEVGLAHRVSLALQAKEFYLKDRDYVVVDGAIQVIDPTTQRVAPDRTLGNGLDQALDAKEGLDVRPERQLLAVIDTHAYLHLYPRLAGMTGVVEGEVEAYRDLYGLECVIVPPHRPVRRVDHDPLIYPTDAVMLRAMSKTVAEKRAAGRPVLIGTASDAAAAKISERLLQDGIEHDVLAAKNHALEAEIIARAGRPGAVTVLTRMAGRGVDIRLAEPEGAGLFVLGIGPLASWRLELHLRGRAGRGGDPGESALFLSFQDPYIRMPKLMDRLNESGYVEDPLNGRVVTNLVRSKLNALSAHETEKLARTLRYSAVREEQRAEVYAKRSDVLNSGLTREQTDEILANVLRRLVNAVRTGPDDVDRLSEALRSNYPATVSREVIAAGLTGAPSSKARTDLVEAVVRDARAASETRAAWLGPDLAAELKQRIMLAVMDRTWRIQLRELDDAQDGLVLRTAAGGDPFTEYRRTASRLAAQMWEAIEDQFVSYWFNLEVEFAPADS